LTTVRGLDYLASSTFQYISLKYTSVHHFSSQAN
jgi:hypothetical protein